MNRDGGTPSVAGKLLEPERSGQWMKQNKHLFRFRTVPAPHLRGGQKYIFDLNSVREWVAANKPHKMTVQDYFKYGSPARRLGGGSVRGYPQPYVNKSSMSETFC